MLNEKEVEIDLSRTFKKLDKSNAGFLSSEQIQEMFFLLGWKDLCHPSIFPHILEDIDPNNNDKITLNNLVDGMKHQMAYKHDTEEIKEALSVFLVKNSDSKLSLPDLKRALHDYTQMTDDQIKDLLQDENKGKYAFNAEIDDIINKLFPKQE